MIMKNNRGFLYYAHSNELIDYLRLAICSALTGKYQISNFRATVITDDESIKNLSPADKKLLSYCFENVVTYNKIHKMEKNFKTVFDVFENRGTYKWFNRSRTNAFYDSPYDETILLDVDFIFQDMNLQKLWGSNSPFMISKDVIALFKKNEQKTSGFEKDEKISPFTLPLFWATVVYFQKKEFSKTLFDLVTYIQSNYSYYCKLFNLNSSAYRNDFSFSIALSLLDGFQNPHSEFIMPYKFILATTLESVYNVSLGRTQFIVNTRNWKNNWEIFNLENLSYHCLNKVSLLQKYDQFVKAYT